MKGDKRKRKTRSTPDSTAPPGRPASRCPSEQPRPVAAEDEGALGDGEERVPVVSAIHDTTVRQQTERALRESEQRYRTLVETSHDAITLTDLEGNILMVNQRAVQLYGSDSAADLIGRNALDLIAPEDRAMAIANLQRTIEEGSTRRIEYRVVHKDGTFYPAELSASLILDAQGRPQAFIGVLRDISERKKAEEALWQTRLVVEHSPVILYRVRAEEGWPLEFVSENVAQTGYGAAVFLAGQIQFAALVHPDDLPGVLQTLEQRAARGEDDFQLEYRIMTRGGETRWVHNCVVAVRGPDGRITHYQGVILDVTEHKRLEEQFLQAQKMETVGRLAGGVAHDFNNLLTAIRGYAGLARDALQPADPVRRDIEQVLKAAERAAALTGQLLAFSRRQIVELRPLSLNDLIREMDTILRRLAGEGINLKISLAPDLGVTRLDPSQIEQVLINLVVNARDAMPDGGTLIIETANVALDQEYASQHSGVTPGPFVTLAVSDNGVGMSEEAKAHLFEPFFTTKEAGRGTGLGLATVYGIVKQHHGHISIDSALGRGTMVHIYLPRADDEAGRLTRHEETEPMPRGNETVLVVEDELAVRTLMVRILRSLGYRVLEAADGNEAIHLIRWYQGEVHLLLTDVVMPQLDGKVLADLLLDAFPSLRVLYVSGYASDVIAKRGVLREGVVLLPKPFSAAMLAGKVREVLDGGRDEGQGAEDKGARSR
jgi:two-component system cell cycle sensor histidine kinase/response regulator CckA